MPPANFDDLTPDQMPIEVEPDGPWPGGEDVADGAAPEMGGEPGPIGMDQATADSLVKSLGMELLGRFQERAQQRRQQIELRWADDLAQYNNQYQPAFDRALRERPYGSTVFVPLTRRICNVVEARLGDLLFPTDDRNFAVKASPVQDLDEAMALAQKLPDDAEVPLAGGAVPAADARNSLRELKEEADAKATRMQKVIDDQLQESNYSTAARRVIHDAIKIGTGIIKGPYVLGRVKKRWTMQDGMAMLERIESLNASVVRVDPWNYFPDLSVGDLDAMDGHFELHPMNKAQLARLAALPGFSEDAIRRIIEAGKDRSQDAQAETAQKEAAGTVNVTREAYNLIEYNGPVDHDALVAWGADVPEDNLLVHQAVVWFSEATGEVVKAVLSPMDTDDQPYCVFNWQRDDACVFGYGLPYEIRDMQEAGNSTFRAIMDNMGLSVGGQVVVNDQKVMPANGRWAMEPNKIWRLKDSAQDVKNVFGFYQVASLAQELLAVFSSIKALADELGGPAMAMQGQDAPSFLQAGATGVAMAYNMANVWIRRAVRAWDDQVTTPMIGRFIDWNMQHHHDDGIKGDLNALARGTSALLEAEGYAGRVMALAKISAEAGVPVRRIIAQLRKIAVAMRLDPDELLPDDTEVSQMEEERRKNGPPPNPEMERIKTRQADIEDRRMQREHEKALADQNFQLRLAEMANQNQTTMEDLMVRLGFEAKVKSAELEHEEAKRQSDTQRFNAELAARYQTGAGV